MKGPAPKSAYERVMARVSPIPEAGCFLFGGSLRHGYGSVSVGSVRDGTRAMVGAHRIVWEHHNGPIPDGMFVCHKCDTRSCVNPDHLYLGTHHDNMRDMRERGRSHSHSQSGESNGFSKLDERKVREIRSLDGRFTGREIARRYGVTPANVSLILRREAWRHVS